MAHVVEPVDLAEVVDRAVARVRRRAPTIAFDVKADPWWVVGEGSALERAMTNLLDNAAKWSPPDGVVTIRIAEGVLTVDDEGQGISDADLPHVFDRFYRAEESRSMPGSGLGLSIVRQVVERHSGSVTAGRCPSGGSRFTVRLPGSPAPPERRSRPADRRGDAADRPGPAREVFSRGSAPADAAGPRAVDPHGGVVRVVGEELRPPKNTVTRVVCTQRGCPGMSWGRAWP